MHSKNVLLGITGGIASYKVAHLVRELKKEGFSVRVVMTPFACKFITPMTFHTLSGNKVHLDRDWEDEPLIHIELARWANVFLIAPCTVNTLSKLALGVGDNLLTTTALAYGKSLLIAPAANTVMYKSLPVQENLSRLRKFGHVIIEPESGLLACDEEGEGKLAGVERLKDWIYFSLEDKPLSGKRILITCGATREYIDPVRFISNDASGEMGFSLARVARWLGAEVKVIAGFTTAPVPPEVEIIRAISVDDMYEKVMEVFRWADIVIMNAAVSDFVPEVKSNRKIKKTDELIIRFKKGRDILKELGKVKGNKFLVGFALETDSILENARKKLVEKNLDMIIANPPESIGGREHEGFIITEQETESFRFSSKLESARLILKRVCDNISL